MSNLILGRYNNANEYLKDKLIAVATGVGGTAVLYGLSRILFEESTSKFFLIGGGIGTILNTLEPEMSFALTKSGDALADMVARTLKYYKNHSQNKPLDRSP